MTAFGTFRWHDLATKDVDRSAAFYGAAFGWQCRVAHANGGTFHRLSLDGRDVGSLYRIDAAARERGLRAHWTSYVAVRSVEATAARATAAGGHVLVRPFSIVEPGGAEIARIALLSDGNGAQFGIWEDAGKVD